MKTSSNNSEAARAWTLIELIAILAVIAILGAVILPMLIKETDKSVADQEKATLKSLADAFQQYVLATRVIPDQTTWYSAVSSKLGLGTNDILYNVRQQSHQQPRVFLIDPALQVGLGSAPSGLPYSQSNFVASTANSPMMPVNPRLMIVSSLGKALPSAVASGQFGNTSQPYFNDLWTNADGTVPSDAAWAGWTGSPGDVVVQRIDLTPLFVRLWLGNYNSTNSGYYTIDGVDGVTTPTLVNTVDGFFIQGSVLGLYTNANASCLDTKQILSRNSAFVFENGLWRGSLSGSSMAGGIGLIGDVAQQFLLATPNVNAQNPIGNAQQALVVSYMLSYMSNYNVWASQSFNNPGLKTYLQGIQGSMMSSIQGLYSGAYFPTNPSPCVQ
jgi:type II secretory pathway pseudopilin PulG